MDMRRRKKVGNIREIRSQMHRKEERHKKNVMLQSPCVVSERDYSVNDISDVRCHGWDMGIDKE